MRKIRRDKGAIRLTERDLLTLKWVGEQYAIRLDSLQKLLGRHAQQETKIAGQVRESTARRVVTRWKEEALVDARKYFFGEPEWVWLTGRGLNQMNLSFKTWSPSVSILNHLHEVNEVRMRIEERYKTPFTWRSERYLRHAHWNEKELHIPDGELILEDGSVIAVEIELTQKSLPRVEEIVRKLVRQYDRIWFFVTATTRPVIEGATAAKAEFFRLYDLA